MKWILAAVLVLNVVLGGYQFWQAQQPKQPVQSKLVPQFNNLQPSDAQLDRIKKTSDTVTASKTAQANVSQCIRITGLKESDSLAVVESRLKALELNVNQVRAKEVFKREYQVILGPFNSIDEARAEMVAVNAKGFESFVISKGDYANSLSLGLFSNSENANRRISELAAADVAAKSLQLERFNETIQLVLDKKSSLLIADPTLVTLIDQFEGVDFTRFNCN
jgi:predicted negative regulator of RcsB-dependent stress response